MQVPELKQDRQGMSYVPVVVMVEAIHQQAIRMRWRVNLVIFLYDDSLQHEVALDADRLIRQLE